MSSFNLHIQLQVWVRRPVTKRRWVAIVGAPKTARFDDYCGRTPFASDAVAMICSTSPLLGSTLACTFNN